MIKTLLFVPVAMMALSSCTNSFLGTSAGTAKRGMTKAEVKTALGAPSYQYSLNQQETWVYTESNPMTGHVKSTALNMVPVGGPLVTLASSLRPSTNAAKTAVTFGEDNKVTRIEEKKAAAPAKAKKPAPAR
jgi:outer membrane protein assembly factor BamE (lipoprotein component of BamABCDE complex)